MHLHKHAHLEVTLKVTDKHYQSTPYHTCTHWPNHTPVSRWAYTCNKGGDGGVESQGYRGQRVQLSPSFPHY